MLRKIMTAILKLSFLGVHFGGPECTDFGEDVACGDPTGLLDSKSD